MVVLQDVGLRVEIIVNGFPADEYLPNSQIDGNAEDNDIAVLDVGASTCHRYIKSVAGATFSVSVEAQLGHSLMTNWLDLNEKHTIKFRVKLDGHSVGSTWVNDAKRRNVLRSVKNHVNCTRQEFRFAVISLIEEATGGMDAEHLGIIEVKAYRAVRHETFYPRYIDNMQIDDKRNARIAGPGHSELERGDEIVLAEKDTKGRALHHAATLGPATKMRYLPQDNGSKVEWMWVDHRQAPLAIFRFMYRSKDALKQERIIARTPSPELSREPGPKLGPKPEAPTLEDLPKEEVRRLAQDRLYDIYASDRKRAADVKDEGKSETPLKYARLSNGRQAIDLTEDD